MNSIHYILLLAVARMHGERTMNGIIHLLKGKKSSQTIQDISLFECESIAAILKSTPQMNLEKEIHFLYNRNLIKDTSALVEITEKGESTLHYLSQIYEIPTTYIGLKYEWNLSATKYFAKLSLLIQTISNLNNKQHSFIPVSYSREIQHSVKQQIMKAESISELGVQLYGELESILQLRQNVEAETFVLRLTSARRTGRTWIQLAANFHDDPLYTAVVISSIVHELMEKSSSDRQTFPTLADLLPNDHHKTLVTQSTEKTKEILSQGNSLSQIALIRNLKISTIEDHIIELSLHDPLFDKSTFITDEEVQRIQNIAKRLKTKRLRQIKQEAGESYSYFQIRLALSTNKGALNY